MGGVHKKVFMLKRAVIFQGFSKLANATAVCRLSSIGLLNWLSYTNLMIVRYKESKRTACLRCQIWCSYAFLERRSMLNVRFTGVIISVSATVERLP